MNILTVNSNFKYLGLNWCTASLSLFNFECLMHSNTLYLDCYSKVIVNLECCNGNTQRCYQVESKGICYFQPSGTKKKGTWQNASQACKENNSMLPVIENKIFKETLEGYLKEQNSSLSGIWLAGRETRTNEWQWLNGDLLKKQSKLYLKNSISKVF